jgi:hypothetical protein
MVFDKRDDFYGSVSACVFRFMKIDFQGNTILTNLVKFINIKQTDFLFIK